jgi:hypothetical protein
MESAQVGGDTISGSVGPGSPQRFGHRRDLRSVRQRHDELVASEAADDVGRTHAARRTGPGTTVSRTEVTAA